MSTYRITTIATFTVAALCVASPVLALGHDQPDVPDVAAPTVEIPTVDTPSELNAEVPVTRTPAAATPAASTPGEEAGVFAPASDLPTQATISLDGAVDEQVQTPASTPAVDQSATVPAVAVEEQEIGSVEVPGQSVSIPVPAELTVSDAGMSAASADGARGSTSWDGEGSFDVGIEAADKTVTLSID